MGEEVTNEAWEVRLLLAGNLFLELKCFINLVPGHNIVPGNVTYILPQRWYVTQHSLPSFMSSTKFSLVPGHSVS